MNQEPVVANGRKLKVILLEDDPSLCLLFEGIIRDSCQDVDLLAFENGDEAWRELSRSQPDVLITDSLHPGLHGGVIVGRLAESHPKCSVLWTSGGSDEEFTPRFAGLRIEFLPKPFGREQFQETLDRLLGSKNIPAVEIVPLIQNRPNAGSGRDSTVRQ
jgi:DNA-binding NtrC family response regulator